MYEATAHIAQAWWHMPIIPAPVRWKQENQEGKTILT